LDDIAEVGQDLTPAEKFIERWKQSSGAERANYAIFLTELCDLIGVKHPDPAREATELNAYTFERAVTFREPDGSTAKGRIDLYKRGCFVLEAKQSRLEGGRKASAALRGQDDCSRRRVQASRAGDGARAGHGTCSCSTRAAKRRITPRRCRLRRAGRPF
jgi:hypothetical protein